MQINIDHYLDITSDVCPITFVKAKLLLEKMCAGEVAEVRLCEGEPLENVPQSITDEGHQVLSLEPDQEQAGVYVLVLQKS